MRADHEQRTERPTEARRRRAREEGHVARSRDLVVALTLLALVVVAAELGPTLGRDLAAMSQDSISEALRPAHRSGEALTDLVLGAALATLYAILPACAAVVAVAVLAGTAQGGWLLRPAAVMPNWTRVGPTQSRRGAMSARGLGRAAFAVAKIVFLGWIVVRGVEPIFGEAHAVSARALSSDSLSSACRAGWDHLVEVASTAAWGLLVLGGLDWLFQRWQLERDLMMSPREVLEELAEQQPAPETRASRRRFFRRLRSREGGER